MCESKIYCTVAKKKKISCFPPPTLPQRHVRIYNLTKRELSKKLQTGAKWISSLDIHPGGDNLLVSISFKKKKKSTFQFPKKKSK